jgi:hypothetical protein
MWLCMMDQEQHNDEHCRHDIEWADVEAAIDSLNNTTITWIQLGIGKDDEMWLEEARWFDVIGGNQNRVLVSFRSEDPDDETDYFLRDPSQTERISVYNARLHDDLNWYEPEAIVDKSLAKHVMKHFFDHQERLIEGITWE